MSFFIKRMDYMLLELSWLTGLLKSQRKLNKQPPKQNFQSNQKFSEFMLDLSINIYIDHLSILLSFSILNIFQIKNKTECSAACYLFCELPSTRFNHSNFFGTIYLQCISLSLNDIRVSIFVCHYQFTQLSSLTCKVL